MREFLEGIGYNSWILPALLILPLVAAAVIMLVGPRRRPDGVTDVDAYGASRLIALGTFVLLFVLSMGLWWSYDPALATFQAHVDVPWIPDWGARFTVGVDGIAVMMILLTTLIMPLAVAGSWSGIRTKLRSYYALLLILTVGMLGVFMALDFMLFYVMWEIMLVPMYFIIGMWGGERRLYATLKFFIYTMVGSILMLVAIVWLWLQTTAPDMQIGADVVRRSFAYADMLSAAAASPGAAFWLFAAFFLAFAIKVPMFPFHTWLPDAHVEAPTAGSVLLAGVLLKLGGYGFIRFAVPLFPDAATAFAPAIIVLSLIGIIYGAIVALVQPDLKKLVAYSSVSHMGFVTLGIFIFQEQGMSGAVLQMINHGIITGALFLCVGVIYERTHDRTIAKMGGLASVTPVYAALFGFFMLASLGLPGLSGFVGEFLVFIGTFAYSPVAAAVAAVVVMLAAAYLMWMYQRVVFGEVSEFLKGLGHHLTDVTPRELLTLTPLVALTIAFGLFPGWLTALFEAPVASVIRAVTDSPVVGLGR